MSYFLITSGEDGLCAEGPLTKSQLLEELDPENYGKPLAFQSKLKTSEGYLVGADIEGPSKLAVIIKGEIIIPKPKEVVKTFEL